MNYRFPKTERLTSQIIIDQLFDRKNEQVQSLFVYPFRAVFLDCGIGELEAERRPISNEKLEIRSGTPPDLEIRESLISKSKSGGVPLLIPNSPLIPNSKFPKILISVPKRQFKRAVDRNLIKRRIREAYRLNKHLLLQNPEAKIPHALGFLYVGKVIEDFDLIEKKMKTVLSKLTTPAIPPSGVRGLLL